MKALYATWRYVLLPLLVMAALFAVFYGLVWLLK